MEKGDTHPHSKWRCFKENHLFYRNYNFFT